MGGGGRYGRMRSFFFFLFYLIYLAIESSCGQDLHICVAYLEGIQLLQYILLYFGHLVRFISILSDKRTILLYFKTIYTIMDTRLPL